MHDSAPSPATPFRQLLEDYLQRLPGSDAVALVDGEGEAVDQAGNADDFDVRIFAATLAIVAESARGQWSAGWTHLAIGFARESYHLVKLAHAYCIVSRCVRASFGIATPCADSVVSAAICREAGWPVPRDEWHPVAVRDDGAGAPHHLAGDANGRTMILGRMPPQSAASAKFLVRLPSGQEVVLAREGFRHWYADQKVAN
jgi:hypothetical protein